MTYVWLRDEGEEDGGRKFGGALSAEQAGMFSGLHGIGASEDTVVRVHIDGELVTGRSTVVNRDFVRWEVVENYFPFPAMDGHRLTNGTKFDVLVRGPIGVVGVRVYQ